MKRKFALLLIIIFVFSLPLFSNSFILASADTSSEEASNEYLTIEITRMIYKNGSIENKLVFDFDINKRSDWPEGDMMSDASFTIQAKKSLDKIKKIFDNQNRVITFENQVRIEIILSQYRSHTEEALRNEETDFDKPSVPNIEKGTAYNKYLSTRSLALSNIDGVVKECVDIALGTPGLHKGAVIYIETYGFPYSFKKINSNADEKFFDSKVNLNMHRFHATESQLNEKKISFVQKVPNSVFWYSLTISVTVFSLLCLMIYLQHKKKRDKAI